MKSFGQMRNEMGVMDIDVLLARKLAVICGKPPEICMNWETNDETMRWEVAFWDAEVDDWTMVADDSVFGCLWRALRDRGLEEADLIAFADDSFKDQDRAYAAFREKNEKAREARRGRGK